MHIPRPAPRSPAMYLSLVCAVFWLTACLAAVPGWAEPKFPALTGRVVDDAGILSAADRAELTETLRALEEKSSDQLVVYTTRSLQGYPIEDFGYQLGRAWQIGQKGKDNGVLLIVAPNEHDVRIEVGYGLEGDLTDAVTRLIIETSILPKFRAGDMAGGIAAGVDDVIKVLTGDAAAYKVKAEQQPKSYEPSRPENGGGLSFGGLLLTIAFVVILLRVGGLWWPLLLGGGGRGGWSSGGWSSGGGGWSSGGGGGGFSGGGGSFGGGGSSGHW
jgi:uncharacterized protein